MVRRSMGRNMVRQQYRQRRRRRSLLGGALLVGTGVLAYKLGKKSAQQIEQYAGRPIDELSDDEIQTAMNDLGIEGEALTEDDRAAMAADEGRMVEDMAPTQER